MALSTLDIDALLAFHRATFGDARMEDPAPTGDGEPPAPKADDAPPAELGDAGKKAIDAERRNARAAAKERDALAAKLKEYEDRDKSETDKAAERAAEAERRAAEAESRALRLEIAAEKGLNAAQAKRLVGSTREELEADADELLTTFKPVTTAPFVPSFDGGTRRPAGVAKGAAGLAEAEKRFGTKDKH